MRGGRSPIGCSEIFELLGGQREAAIKADRPAAVEDS